MIIVTTWGNRHFAPEGPSLVIVNSETGELAEPVLVNRISGRPLSDPIFRTAPGPAANERTRSKDPAPGKTADADPKDTP